MDPRELWQPDGEKIRQYRRRLGLGRADLAAKAGVSPHTLARAERSTPMFPATLRIIADAFGTSVEDLCVPGTLLTEFSEQEQRWIGVVVRMIETYNDASMRLDMEPIRREFPRLLDKDVEWTLAATETVPFSGVFRGIAGVMSFFETSLGTVRREEAYRFDHIQSAGNYRLLIEGVDRYIDSATGDRVTAACTYDVSFRDDRISRFQVTAIIVNREPRSNQP